IEKQEFGLKPMNCPGHCLIFDNRVRSYRGFVFIKLHSVPLLKVFKIGTKQWRYYDFGPKVVPPLICLPGTAGTADVYYKQIMALSIKGYRVISVDIPCVWNSLEWVQAFEKFLDVIDVHHIHLYGTSLGGFLALLFAQHRPRRVKSLVLSNAFLETKYFAAAMPWAPVYVPIVSYFAAAVYVFMYCVEQLDVSGLTLMLAFVCVVAVVTF
ncbi:hypothetical protein SSX86_032099, partial [Deinandra increscens subsp. villosa]